MATAFEPAIGLVLASQRDALQRVLDTAHEALAGVERMSALTLRLARDSLATSGGQARALLAAADGERTGGATGLAAFEPDHDWGASYNAQAWSIAAELTGSLTERLHGQVWAAHHVLADSLLAMAGSLPHARDDAIAMARAMLQATPRTIADAIDAACLPTQHLADAAPRPSEAAPAPAPVEAAARRRRAAAGTAEARRAPG